MGDKGRSIVLGGGLILIGVWLLARALGADIPGWDRLWPLILIGVALGSLYSALASDPRDTGGVWFGVAGAVAGGLFLYITMGQGEWADMATLWPIFPLAAGLGWLAAWLARPREVADLVMGACAMAAAGISYLYTQGRLAPEVGPLLLEWWPLILILLGLGYIVQYALQRR